MTETLTVIDIIPHRDRMLLLDEIVAVDSMSAVTRSKVTEQWPLYQSGSINPLIMVELVAQAAGVAIGVEAMKKEKKKSGEGGWLVGIKNAHFLIDKIPVPSLLVTTVKKTFIQENYTLLDGEITMDDRIIGTVSIQIMRSITPMTGEKNIKDLS